MASCIAPGDHGSTFAGEGSTTNGSPGKIHTPKIPQIPKKSKEVPNHKLGGFPRPFGIFQKNMDEILGSTIFGYKNRVDGKEFYHFFGKGAFIILPFWPHL